MEDGYNELLKVLKNNPPYIESHVKALEIEVSIHQLWFIVYVLGHFYSLLCSAVNVVQQINPTTISFLYLLEVLPSATVFTFLVQVQLAQKQFEDMCEHRNALYHATEAANENKVRASFAVFYVSASDILQ